MGSLATGLVALLAICVAATPADARSKRKRERAPAYTPPYAAMVVDANSGKVLFAQNENALRHPASITKVMTLYMLFEQMERGRIRPDTPIQISANAASQPPTKIGLRPGATITVDNAIKALVTKSANDISVAIAEHLAGSEEAFAQQMTRKARSLGMTRTNFANASGLPDPEQITTARDLTILGRAIQERFPKQFGYFSLHAFQFGGSQIRNHNKLLGRIEGVDGIKTGYTRASGFNLLTSARRDGRRIVAVVLGGRSGAHRDNIMANLVEEHLDRGARVRSAPMIAENTNLERALDAAEAAAPTPPAARRPEPARVAEAPPPAPAPVPVPARAVEPVQPPVQLAAYAPEPRPAVVSGALSDGASTASIRTATPGADARTGGTTPSTLRWATGPRPLVTGQSSAPGDLTPPGAIPGSVAAPAPMRVAAATPVAAAPAPAPLIPPAGVTSQPRETASRPAAARTGVMIQVGASDDQAKAQALLAKARAQGRGLLASAQPFTEKVQKGGETLWRARFAGLDESRAEAACKALKRSGVACFTTRN
jgi:D-alanyl-D-alanine carboxypeptidase